MKPLLRGALRWACGINLLLVATMATAQPPTCAAANANGTPGECVDGSPGTQRHDMHACLPQPNGALRYVTGLHAANNILLCDGPLGYSIASTIGAEAVVSFATHAEYGIPACPIGSAITGIRLDRQQFLCAPFAKPSNERLTRDPGDPILPGPPGWLCKTFRIDCPANPTQPIPTQRNGMHVCPSGQQALIGLDPQTNTFVCSPALNTN